MENHTQPRVFQNMSAKEKISTSSFEDGELNRNINTTEGDIGLPVMPGNAAINGNVLGLTFSVAEHITATDVPAFGSLGGGGFRNHPSSTISLWTCCNCYHSGMAVRSTDWCPNCSHQKCSYCETYKTRGY